LNGKTIRLLSIYNRDQAARISFGFFSHGRVFFTFAGLLPWRRREKLTSDQPLRP
jgi:hypothetical protein